MGGNEGGNTAGSIMPASARSLTCPVRGNAFTAPLALALTRQAAQATRSETQSSLVPQQLQPDPVDGEFIGL